MSTIEQFPVPPPGMELDIRQASSEEHADPPCLQYRKAGYDDVSLAGGASCVASARLPAARRIRVSSGAPDRSRGAENICGIMVEYWDDTSTAIAGQWINEIGAFDLGSDETLIEIKVWSLLQDENERIIGRGYSSKVNGLCFITSSGRKGEFLSGGAHTTSTTYCGTPFEELVRLRPFRAPYAS